MRKDPQQDSPEQRDSSESLRESARASRPKSSAGYKYDEAELSKRLADEYKMLQEKIDKIGGFRFTIKGWSVTAVIAGSAAATAAQSVLTATTVSLGLVFMLIVFFSLELEQVRLSRLFGSRAGRIEDAFRDIDRGRGKEVAARFRVPYTAHETVQASHRRSQHRAGSGGFRSKWRRLRGRWRIGRQAHIVFYVLFLLLAIGPLIPRYHEIGGELQKLQIGSGWRKLRDYIIHVPTHPSAKAAHRP